MGTCVDMPDATTGVQSVCDEVEIFSIKVTRNCNSCQLGLSSIGILIKDTSQCWCNRAVKYTEDQFYDGIYIEDMAEEITDAQL